MKLTPLRLVRLFFLFGSVIFIASCSREKAMKQAAASLKAGMNEAEVQLAFKGFPVLNTTNELGILTGEEEINHRQTGGDIDRITHLFGSEKSYNYKIDFEPGSFGDWCGCSVFLGTNKNLIGYQFWAIH